MAPLLLIPKFHISPTFSTQTVSWGFGDSVGFQYLTTRRASWKCQHTHLLKLLVKAFFGLGPAAPLARHGPAPGTGSSRPGTSQWPGLPGAEGGAGRAGSDPRDAAQGEPAGMVTHGPGRARLAAGAARAGRAARSGSGGGIPAAPMEERARNGRERGGDSGGGAALWRAPGRGWCEEPHFNEGRANANHCNRQQQKKGEAAAARAPQQRATARGGVTKAAEPLSAATTATTAGWSRGGRAGAAALWPLPIPSRRLPSAPGRQV